MKTLEQEKFKSLTTLNKAQVKELFDEVSEHIEEQKTSYEQLFTPREQRFLDNRVTTQLYKKMTHAKKMKEATLSIISYLLIDKPQKRAIQKIYKYMDKSENGCLEAKELHEGYKNILQDLDDEQLLERIGLSQDDFDPANYEWAADIVENADIDNSKTLDFNDFLLASVDLQESSFYVYCDRAYELLFDNDEESVEV